jgi:hypothetical protein
MQGEVHLTRHDAIYDDQHRVKGRCTSLVQRTGWARGLELVGDDERCVALAGLLPVRLLAERAELRAALSAAMRQPGYDPDYDRGQVLLDLGLGPVG